MLEVEKAHFYWVVRTSMCALLRARLCGRSMRTLLAYLSTTHVDNVRLAQRDDSAERTRPSMPEDLELRCMQIGLASVRSGSWTPSALDLSLFHCAFFECGQCRCSQEAALAGQLGKHWLPYLYKFFKSYYSDE